MPWRSEERMRGPDVERFLPPPPDEVVGFGVDAVGDAIKTVMDIARKPLDYFSGGANKVEQVVRKPWR